MKVLLNDKEYFIFPKKETNGLTRLKLLDAEHQQHDFKEFPELQSFQKNFLCNQVTNNILNDFNIAEGLLHDNINFLRCIYVEYFTGERKECSQYLYEHFDAIINTAITILEFTQKEMNNNIEKGYKQLKDIEQC